MTNEDYFAAPWDNFVKGTTASVYVLLIVLIIVFYIVIDNLPVKIGIIILFGSILFIPYLWAPQGYKILGRTVFIKRLIGDLKIHVEREPERWKWTYWGLRLFGSGGLYGYYGLFTFRNLGRVLMYATNRHNLILLQDEHARKIMISPTNPEKIIQLLRK
jgi:hypothetical protein